MLDGITTTTPGYFGTAISGDEVRDSTLTSDDIADAAVTSGKIFDSAVIAGKIDDSSIASGKVADGAVIAAKIGASAVTAGKVDDSSIASGKIADGAVGFAKLNKSFAAGSVAITTDTVGAGSSTWTYGETFGAAPAVYAAGSAGGIISISTRAVDTANIAVLASDDTNAATKIMCHAIEF